MNQILEISIAILIVIIRFVVGDDLVLEMMLLRGPKLIIVRVVLMKSRVDGLR